MARRFCLHLGCDAELRTLGNRDGGWCAKHRSGNKAWRKTQDGAAKIRATHRRYVERRRHPCACGKMITQQAQRCVRCEAVRRWQAGHRIRR